MSGGAALRTRASSLATSTLLCGHRHSSCVAGRTYSSDFCTNLAIASRTGFASAWSATANATSSAVMEMPD
ncbi:hypothetical protein [Lysobacter gummosus]|uniref:hypothetical protein n=1 Tax=Lysobacter gummosus TaxID=262324 RepID=UPI003635C8AC